MTKKKDDSVGIWTMLKWTFIFFIFVFGSIWAMSTWGTMINEDEDRVGRCEGYGYMDSAYDCCVDCHKIDQEYFKYKYVDHGFLTEEEYQCICEYNGTTNKIY